MDAREVLVKSIEHHKKRRELLVKLVNEYDNVIKRLEQLKQNKNIDDEELAKLLLQFYVKGSKN